jgi:hypothetical protein
MIQDLTQQLHHTRSIAHIKTPWPGDPRINLQEGGGGKAKPYQVQQVIQALKTSKSGVGE